MLKSTAADNWRLQDVHNFSTFFLFISFNKYFVYGILLDRMEIQGGRKKHMVSRIICIFFAVYLHIFLFLWLIRLFQG